MKPEENRRLAAFVAVEGVDEDGQEGCVLRLGYAQSEDDGAEGRKIHFRASTRCSRAFKISNILASGTKYPGTPGVNGFPCSTLTAARSLGITTTRVLQPIESGVNASVNSARIAHGDL